MKNLLTVLILCLVFLTGTWMQPVVYAVPEPPTCISVRLPINIRPEIPSTVPEPEIVPEKTPESPFRAIILEVMTQYNPKLTKDEQRAILDAILTSAEVYQLDPLLIAAVIAAESSFRVKARSSCGAIGLMQIMPIHGWRADLTTIEGNIDTGAWYLALNRDRFGSDELAVAAYNAGPGRVRSAGGIPKIKETQVHVKRVMGIYEGLQEANS